MASSEYKSTYGIPYSEDSVLNTVDIHLPADQNATEGGTGLWIIFIHGGAWRDPTQTSRDLGAALRHLPPRESHIAGMASINYRLSPHPGYPALPGSADEKARSARHPMHIHDVQRAIAWLQTRHGFAENYLLAGHSAGATLAFQTVMRKWSAAEVILPRGVVGVCGIFDLSLFVANHEDQPVYRNFVEGAFGADEATWQEASPISGLLSESWPNGQAVVLAPSKDDELVEFAQSEVMSDHLWKEKRSIRRDVVISLTGTHQDVVKEGKELARAIIKCLEMVS